MSQLKLAGEKGELVVSIDERSWHVLDHAVFFPNGFLLRKAFGTDFAKGLFKKPTDGILQRIRAIELGMYCQRVWEDLLRDKDLLSYSYMYEFGDKIGEMNSGGCSGFRVRGFNASIWSKPKGYCTVELHEASPTGEGRTVEYIDLRGRRSIQTDDRGLLSVHRRKMAIDWYQEMPRILEFCERNPKGNIEVQIPS